MLPRIFAFAVPLCLLAFACGESGAPIDTSADECRAHCEDSCSALERCRAASNSCSEECTAGARNCDRATPPNQLTCAELVEEQACWGYCVAFCDEVADCAGFDEALCLVGCKDREPMICNALSVGARTCDQLKPEAREYDRAGEVLTSDDDGRSGVVTGGYHTLVDFGLCESANDCEEGGACSAATNTCGPCATDAECTKRSGEYLVSRAICSAERTCVIAPCGLTDDDCKSESHPFCDYESHSCVACTADTDCPDGKLCSDHACL